jgi:hypothetical protein
VRSALRYPAVAAAATALAIGAAACGSSSADTASSTASKAASAAPASPAAPTPAATIAKLTGVDTQVTLDPSTAGVLKQNNVSVAPVSPATAKVEGANTIVAFPITAGHVSLYDKSVQSQGIPWIQGEVDHSGGLTFSAGGKELTVTNFIVDPGKSMLTATAGGAQVPLFFLDGSTVAVSKDAAGHVLLDGTVAKLTQQAADVLNTTFGVTLFAKDIPVGTVHLTAAG